MSLAHVVLAFLEQMNGSGTSSNGSSSGNTNTEEPTDSTDTENGEKEPEKEKPNKSFHRHVLGGYGPYYCSCDKDTPKEYRCPNCKKRGK